MPPQNGASIGDSNLGLEEKKMSLGLERKKEDCNVFDFCGWRSPYFCWGQSPCFCGRRFSSLFMWRVVSLHLHDKWIQLDG